MRINYLFYMDFETKRLFFGIGAETNFFESLTNDESANKNDGHGQIAPLR